MRITFQTTEINQTIDRQNTAQRESSVRTIGTGSGYTLDISGAGMNHEVYRERGKTMEEVMQEAASQDVALTHNYMAVMSHSMSDEDFAKLEKDGYRIGDTDVETAVTIVDQIKASLIQGGVSIAGYTDTLDTDTLTEITGDAALAEEMSQTFTEREAPLTEETAKEAVQALDEAQMLTEPGDDTMKYMVVNEKEPTLQNLYMAQYSSVEGASRQGRGYFEDNGYLSKKADQINWDSLQPQIDQIIEEAGFEENPEAQEAARWLIGAGVPLTKDTLASYMELKKISVPMERRELLRAMATAVSDGRAPKDASLTGTESLWERAAAIWERTREITKEAADLTADQGKDLTLQNLYAAQKLLESGYRDVTQENVSARRQLEEIRLQMTISANRELLKSGYAIETTQLEEVVEALKEVENQTNQTLFGTELPEEADARAALYEETTETVRRIPHMPAAVVGRVYTSHSAFTLGVVREEGEALAAAYRKANESYETLQTAPRSDMGDSIKKAFRNVEALLEELGLEATDANKRAVRILGYNSLEITEESIQAVKEADQTLRGVVEKLTPAAALRMIREGKNPLTVTLSELDDYLSGRQQSPEEEQEKYSKFLYKLERKKEITEEEKESYIGIYRLLRQVEKSDGAVIGSLLRQGAELSFQNLLTAVRTYRAKRMDTVVDDNMGTVQKGEDKGVSIDAQINAAFAEETERKAEREREAGYYERLGHEIYDRLDADKLFAIAPDDSMDLETFAEALRETQTDEESDAAYLKEQIGRCRETPAAQDETVRMLEMLDEPVTFENIRAMDGYRHDIAQAFARVRKEAGQAGGRNAEALRQRIAHLEESFTGKEEAVKAYEELSDTEKGILEDAMYEPEAVTSLSVKELGLVYKQVSFTAKMANTERYDIPVLMEDSVMALHIRIVHSDEEKGMVEASIDMEQYGKLSVKLQVQEGAVSGFLIGSEQGSGGHIQEIADQIKERLSQMGLRTGGMDIGFRKDLQTGFSSEKSEGAAQEGKQTSTRELYGIAKAVIHVVRKQAERGFSL